MSQPVAPSGADSIAAFYDRHPYPPPVADLADYAASWRDPDRRRAEHHRLWPARPVWCAQPAAPAHPGWAGRPGRAGRAGRGDPTVLVAGCGTSQAARYAVRYPAGRVVGIDVSETSLRHTRALAERHGLDNLQLHRLPLEGVADLGEQFDLTVCTGVLHHLADPAAGLRALAGVLAPGGALSLMVYARYGRFGVDLLREYCRRLGVGSSPAELADLVATLRELPAHHPLGHLLRATPDFQDDDALADALLNPRERAYSVPELLALVAEAGLGFGRWLRQAPYLPRCGVLASTPHARRVAALPLLEQYAAMELFRGTLTRHSLVAYRAGEAADRAVRFDDERWRGYVPLRPPSVVVVAQRLPPGAAAALLDRAQPVSDLVLFVTPAELTAFEAVDGERTMGEIAALSGVGAGFFERLWQHDLMVVDASARATAAATAASRRDDVSPDTQT